MVVNGCSKGKFRYLKPRKGVIGQQVFFSSPLDGDHYRLKYILYGSFSRALSIYCESTTYNKSLHVASFVWKVFQHKSETQLTENYSRNFYQLFCNLSPPSRLLTIQHKVTLIQTYASAFHHRETFVGQWLFVLHLEFLVSELSVLVMVMVFASITLRITVVATHTQITKRKKIRWNSYI